MMMKVEIVYCDMWNYKPHAIRAMAEMKQILKNADYVLTAGRGGVFDVFVDGNLIYSKKGEGRRFPEQGLLTKRIQAL